MNKLCKALGIRICVCNVEIETIQMNSDKCVRHDCQSKPDYIYHLNKIDPHSFYLVCKNCWEGKFTGDNLPYNITAYGKQPTYPDIHIAEVLNEGR